MKELHRLVPVLLALALGGCLGQGTKPSTAPANFSVAPGESQVVLTWKDDPGLTYWIYYKKGTTTGPGNVDQIVYQATSPYDLTGLTNLTQYAFAITSSHNGSEVGPFTPVQTGKNTTPRLIGPSATWTVGTPLPTSYQLNSIAFGNNDYVAVGNAATAFSAAYDYTSTGGVVQPQSWQKVTLPSQITSTVNLTGVVYDGSQFVVLGDNGSILTSPDSTTWTLAGGTAGTAGMNAIAYGNGIYVAVGNNGAIYRNTSGGLDSNWTAETSNAGGAKLYGVAFVNNEFIAVGASGTLLTSPDGVTWTAQSSAATAAGSNTLYGVAYGAGLYVAVGDAGTVLTSSDGTTWTQVSPLPTNYSLYAVTFGPDDQFVAVGQAGTTVYYNTNSANGPSGTWSSNNTGTNQEDLHGIAPNAVYIAVGAAGANVSAK